jgi:hypothetical protein
MKEDRTAEEDLVNAQPRTGHRLSPYRKLQLRTLLDRAEYDMQRITFMHRRLGVPDEIQGRPVDEWIDSLDERAAMALIERIKAQLADSDSE